VVGDAILQPAFTLLTDPTLTPCPACGNGQIEPLEDCDGRGTCPGSGEVCVPAGSPGECSCAATCGTVAGIQPGEDCDGTDLGGATCVSLGFGGGTLSCGADCAFDTSQCGPERCGDGLVGPDEQCDLGTATCIGGSNGGAPCCAKADCPGGDCPGDGCTANRNDIAGCCRCDCTLSPTVTTTTSTSSSTSSPGATSSTSTTVPPECTPGTPGACDDGDRCTVDSCAGAGGCRHDPLGYDAIAASLAPSLDLQACSGQRIPPAIGRLMKQARKLVERAAHARRPKRAKDLVRRALGELSTAVRTVQRAGRRRLSPDCAGALAAIVGDARAETACLLRPALASPALTAPTGRE